MAQIFVSGVCGEQEIARDRGSWLFLVYSSLNRIFSFTSDPIIHDIGSSATFGNSSNSPETDGAYVIPSAMLKKDGFVLAWEFFASKLGSIQLQVSGSYTALCNTFENR